MWGAIIGGALQLASSLYGGYKASEKNQQAMDRVKDLKNENRAWYDSRYYEDATQRADAQRVLTRMSEELRKRNKAAEGRAAVTGGTEESVAAQKAAGNEAMANAVSQIAAQGEARKDAIEQQYRATDAGLTGELNKFDINAANQITSAASQAAKSAGGIATGKDGYIDANNEYLTQSGKRQKPQPKPTPMDNYYW